MFNRFTNTFLSFHLLHALFYILKWDVEHARDVEWGDGIHATRLTFHANQVLDVLLRSPRLLEKDD